MCPSATPRSFLSNTPVQLPRKLLLALVVGSLVVMTACQSSPPRGTSSGRVPVGWSTPAEAGDARPLPDDLIAFSDDWAQSLMRDLPEIPVFSNAPTRATILYGDILNKTDFVSSTDFETVRERIKNQLMKSQSFKNRFRFLIARAQLDELRRREVNDPTMTDRFDQSHTYLLNGTMFRVGRGDTHYYLMTFELVDFTSGEIIWTDDYETKRFGY